MPVTLHELAGSAELALRVLAAPDATGRQVRWVHVSELDDPTPFLGGGELLLTTGLGLGRAEPVWEYVERLAAAGVVGLGFGTGLSHDRVPEELLDAAERCGLPVLEVPRATPFIAISRAVWRALAADEYAAVTRTYTAQQALTRAALAPRAPGTVVTRLAQQLGGWAVLLDPRGTPLHASPPAALRRAADLAPEVERLRVHRAPASAALTARGDAVLLQSLGNGSRTRGFLAVGRATPFSVTDRHIVNAAVLLLTLRSEQARALDGVAASLRSALLRLLLAGHADAVAPVLAELGEGLPAEPVRVVVVAATRVLRAAAADLARDVAPDPLLSAELDGVTVLVVAAPGADAVLANITRVDGAHAGMSGAVPLARVADAYRQARRAAEHGARTGQRATRFAELAGGTLLGLVEPGRAAAFAEALLAPVVEHDRTQRGDLLVSLTAWLGNHGHWDATAAQLGVHRHTLRKRIHRVEELLGRGLDSPGVRAELWLALQAREETEVDN
ncbi:MAG: transcriptional regulator, PucR family [Mycobacterium sp.]|nr:transcriptional regulator, PucR family [Mycobacterium sp.]